MEADTSMLCFHGPHTSPVPHSIFACLVGVCINRFSIFMSLTVSFENKKFVFKNPSFVFTHPLPTMADPGFPRWGVPTPDFGVKIYFFAKNCMKTKEIRPRGCASQALSLPVWHWISKTVTDRLYYRKLKFTDDFTIKTIHFTDHFI